MSRQAVKRVDDHDIIIDKLKARFHVHTDQELARAMNLSRSAVATWRMRRRVPSRYVEIANGPQTASFYGGTPWHMWSELEKAAMELALMRLMRDFGAMLQSFPEFLQLSLRARESVAEYHSVACEDLALHMVDNKPEDERRSLTMLVFDEFFSSQPNGPARGSQSGSQSPA